jgi:hypothetical protein
MVEYLYVNFYIFPICEDLPPSNTSVFDNILRLFLLDKH